MEAVDEWIFPIKMVGELAAIRIKGQSATRPNHSETKWILPHHICCAMYQPTIIYGVQKKNVSMQMDYLGIYYLE